MATIAGRDLNYLSQRPADQVRRKVARA